MYSLSGNKISERENHLITLCNQSIIFDKKTSTGSDCRTKDAQQQVLQITVLPKISPTVLCIETFVHSSSISSTETGISGSICTQSKIGSKKKNPKWFIDTGS